MLNRLFGNNPWSRGAILALCGIWLASCAPEAVHKPPDGGKAPQPFGELLMCAQNPEHEFCD